MTTTTVLTFKHNSGGRDSVKTVHAVVPYITIPLTSLSIDESCFGVTESSSSSSASSGGSGVMCLAYRSRLNMVPLRLQHGYSRHQQQQQLLVQQHKQQQSTAISSTKPVTVASTQPLTLTPPSSLPQSAPLPPTREDRRAHSLQHMIASPVSHTAVHSYNIHIELFFHHYHKLLQFLSSGYYSSSLSSSSTTTATSTLKKTPSKEILQQTAASYESLRYLLIYLSSQSHTQQSQSSSSGSSSDTTNNGIGGNDDCDDDNAQHTYSLICTDFLSAIELYCKDLVYDTCATVTSGPNYSKSGTEFRLLTSLLYHYYKEAFYEIIGLLGRKLEPEITTRLFPLYLFTDVSSSSGSDSISGNSIGNNSNSINSCNVINQNEYSFNYLLSLLSRDITQQIIFTPLDLYEHCIITHDYFHSSRFLTLACDYVGGSESMQGLVKSLLLSTELLYESVRRGYLPLALECLDFCQRLEDMLNCFSQKFKDVESTVQPYHDHHSHRLHHHHPSHHNSSEQNNSNIGTRVTGQAAVVTVMTDGSYCINREYGSSNSSSNNIDIDNTSSSSSPRNSYSNSDGNSREEEVEGTSQQQLTVSTSNQQHAYHSATTTTASHSSPLHIDNINFQQQQLARVSSVQALSQGLFTRSIFNTLAMVSPSLSYYLGGGLIWALSHTISALTLLPTSAVEAHTHAHAHSLLSHSQSSTHSSHNSHNNNYSAQYQPVADRQKLILQQRHQQRQQKRSTFSTLSHNNKVVESTTTVKEDDIYYKYVSFASVIKHLSTHHCILNNSNNDNATTTPTTTTTTTRQPYYSLLLIVLITQDLLQHGKLYNATLIMMSLQSCCSPSILAKFKQLMLMTINNSGRKIKSKAAIDITNMQKNGDHHQQDIPSSTSTFFPISAFTTPFSSSSSIDRPQLNPLNSNQTNVVATLSSNNVSALRIVKYLNIHRLVLESTLRSHLKTPVYRSTLTAASQLEFTVTCTSAAAVETPMTSVSNNSVITTNTGARAVASVSTNINTTSTDYSNKSTTVQSLSQQQNAPNTTLSSSSSFMLLSVNSYAAENILRQISSSTSPSVNDEVRNNVNANISSSGGGSGDSGIVQVLIPSSVTLKHGYIPTPTMQSNNNSTNNQSDYFSDEEDEHSVGGAAVVAVSPGTYHYFYYNLCTTLLLLSSPSLSTEHELLGTEAVSEGGGGGGVMASVSLLVVVLKEYELAAALFISSYILQQPPLPQQQLSSQIYESSLSPTSLLSSPSSSNGHTNISSSYSCELAQRVWEMAMTELLAIITVVNNDHFYHSQFNNQNNSGTSNTNTRIGGVQLFNNIMNVLATESNDQSEKVMSQNQFKKYLLDRLMEVIAVCKLTRATNEHVSVQVAIRKLEAVLLDFKNKNKLI